MDWNWLQQVEFEPVLPVPVLAVLGVVAIGLVLYAYIREGLTRISLPMALVLAAMRIGVLVLLLLMLAQPRVTREIEERQQPHVAILVDESESMNLRDQGEGSARFDVATSLVVDDLVPALEGAYQPRVYTFASNVRSSAPEEIGSRVAATGGATDLGGALREVLARETGQALAAVLVLTDGAQNTGTDPETVLPEFNNRRVPVYAVGFGGKAEYTDVEVVEAVAPELIFEDEEFDLTIRLNAYGYKGSTMPVRVRMLEGPRGTAESAGAPRPLIAELEAEVVEEAQEIRIEEPLIFEEAGDYRLEVSVPDTIEGDSIEHNNRKEVSFTVRKEKIRVLLVEGRPRREYGFLIYELSADPRLQVLPVLQTRLGRYNFDFPEVWQDFYEKRRPDLEPFTSLFQKHPTEAGQFLLDPDWADFDAVILGDIHSSAFAEGSLSALARSVGNGNSLILAGGIDVFTDPALQQYLDTVLPVRLAGMAEGLEERVFVRPHPRSADHPALQIGNTPSDSAELWEETPPLVSYGRMEDLRSGTVVLLSRYGGREGGEPLEPVWVAAQVGEGNVLVSAVDDTWRWATGLHEGGVGREIFANLWRRTIRWLVTGDVEGVGRGVRIALDKRTFTTGEEVRIGVRAYGFSPSEEKGLSLSLEVRGPQGEVVDTSRREAISAGQPGDARYTTKPARRGEYTIQALLSLDGVEVARAQSEFEAESGNFEQIQAGLNDALLRKIATRTGGQYYYGEEGAAAVSAIPELNRTIIRTKRMDLWDSWGMIAAFFSLLCAEWILRRLRDVA